MTDAGDRRIIDADSHSSELDDLLHREADEAERALIPRMDAPTELLTTGCDPSAVDAFHRGNMLGVMGG